MPVYKDEATNTWYCKFYYSTLEGKRKQTTKRGFPTKREAKQWESEVFKDYTDNDKLLLQKALKEVVINTMEINKREDSNE